MLNNHNKWQKSEKRNKSILTFEVSFEEVPSVVGWICAPGWGWIGTYFVPRSIFVALARELICVWLPAFIFALSNPFNRPEELSTQTTFDNSNNNVVSLTSRIERDGFYNRTVECNEKIKISLQHTSEQTLKQKRMIENKTSQKIQKA